MDKREACHRLAEINEAIYDAQNDLERINSRLVWDDPSNRERLLEEKERVEARLEQYKREHDDFIAEYGDIIYS